ncbi:unnamed protein product [Rotaria sp. Silwood2]|nr:unnamed protein product [Rotaria sp. Silwood2]
MAHGISDEDSTKKEHANSSDVLDTKLDQLAEWIQNAKHFIVFTAITARSSSSSTSANQQSQESTSNLRESKLLAIAVRTNVRLWNIVDASIHTILGTFAFGGPIDNLFFINSQLVATGDERKVGVWHSISQQWQTQELTRILSFDTV